VTDTLCDHFQRQVEVRGDALALAMAGHPGLTWREYGERVRGLAPAFAAAGVTPGAMVPLLMGPRPEFHVVDTALLHAGATPYSLHVGEPVADSVRAVRLTEAPLLVTERAWLDHAHAVAAETGVRVVCVEDDLDDLVAQGGGVDPEALWRAVDPEDIATLIFTSGTTGTPKAVRLSHRALVTSEQSTHALAPFGDPDGTVLSYLPLSHIAERFMSHYASLTAGLTVHSVPDPASLYDELRRVRPTRFFGVPRVYEKLVDRIHQQLAADPALQQAHQVLLAAVRATQAGEPVADARAAQDAHDTLRAVREAIGLDRAEYVGVATAPSAYPMLEQLLSVGLRVSDIWGMSEIIMCTLNPPDAIRLGTVGRFLPGMEGRVADDGELLVRGPHAFSGYVGDPERTAETISPDGWVRTGDLGRIDDGYLTILGRKKELLITATGKNLMPAVIEGAVKSASALIDHVVAIAEGRRHVTALIALDPDELAAFAKARGLDGGFAAVVRADAVRAEVEAAVATGNASLSRPETIRAFAVVDVPWRAGGDELTTTAKLRRAEISEKYATTIEGLYS
jgi:long-chain acyl-CoA synthetase